MYYVGFRDKVLFTNIYRTILPLALALKHHIFFMQDKGFILT
jgi:hypothetical protein